MLALAMAMLYQEMDAEVHQSDLLQMKVKAIVGSCCTVQLEIKSS